MIELTEEEIAIMGRPNFACAVIAKILIGAGVYSHGPKKAEYEQSVYIHWALDLKQKYGDKWRAHGEEILKNCAEKIIADNKANGSA